MLIFGIETAVGDTAVTRRITDNSKRGTEFPANPAHGDLFEIIGTGIHIYDVPTLQWYLLDAITFPYDMAFSFVGKPNASTSALIVRNIIIPANFAGSAAKSSAAATAATTFTIKAGAAVLGTLVFAAGSSTGVFNATTPDQDMLVGKRTMISIVPPSQDATLSDVAVGICATQLAV